MCFLYKKMLLPSRVKRYTDTFHAILLCVFGESKTDRQEKGGRRRRRWEWERKIKAKATYLACIKSFILSIAIPPSKQAPDNICFVISPLPESRPLSFSIATRGDMPLTVSMSTDCPLLSFTLSAFISICFRSGSFRLLFFFSVPYPL